MAPLPPSPRERADSNPKSVKHAINQNRARVTRCVGMTGTLQAYTKVEPKTTDDERGFGPERQYQCTPGNRCCGAEPQSVLIPHGGRELVTSARSYVTVAQLDEL